MPYNSAVSDANIARLKDPDIVLSQVIREISKSEAALADWKAKVVKYYELYQLVQRKKHYEGLASIFVPETLRAVETIVAKLYSMLTGQPDWFQYSGRDNNGDDGAAIALTQLTLFQMDENNFKARLMDCLRQMVIAGLCVRKIGWDYQEVKRKRRGKSGESEAASETVKDVWTFEPVEILSFHISDINIPYNDLQKATWIGEQYLVERNYISERTRRGWFSGSMKAKLDAVIGPASSQAMNLSADKLRASGFTNIDNKSKVELIERWGLVPVEWVLDEKEMAAEGYESGEMIEAVVVIANRCAILKLEKNPFWHNQKPYVACPYIPKENELPGIGVPQIGESLQEEINDTRNQTMDNKTLILATMWLKTRGSGIKNSDLKVRPNGIITTNDINGLAPLRPPVVSGVGTNMESVAKEDLRHSAGAASNLQGIAQPGVGTATEAATVNKESLGRILLTAQLFTELVLKPTLIMAEYNNYQFYDHIKVIKIIGPKGVKFVKISPEELVGYKDVSIKIATDGAENPAVMRQQLLNFFTILREMPPPLIEYHWKILDKVYGMFFNGHDLSELYPNQPVDPRDLLSPEEERDCVLAEQAVVAVRGQDHQSYIQYHENEMESMQNALSDMQFELYKKLIMSHYEALMQQQMEMQQQMNMQMAMAEAGGNSGNMNKGKQKNTSANTMSDAPSTSSMRKEVGG